MLPVLIPADFQNPAKRWSFCGEYAVKLLQPLARGVIESLPSSKMYCPRHLLITANGGVNDVPDSYQVHFSHRGQSFMLQRSDIWYIKDRGETTNYLWVNPKYLDTPKLLTA